MTEQFADPEGRYRLDSRIATGGMGVVWRSTDTRLNRPVAVKVLKAEYADDATFRTRFEGEARSAGSLHHPGIAGVYDYGHDEAGQLPPYLVMELVDGQPLSSLLASAKAGGRTLDTAVVQDLMAQTAAALGVAHRAGIVHRDVKPANLLVTPDRKIKITDFGIARALDSVALTRTGSVMGTPQYLSPEQARGNPSTPASDVYSLGVVAFECLTGRRPFEAETPIATALAHLQQPVPELPTSVPAPLAAVVRRAMAKEPSERYVDGAAFAAALASPSTGPPVPPVAAGPVEGSTQVLPSVPPVPPVAPVPMQRLDTPAAYAGEPLGEQDEDRRSPWPIVLGVLALVIAAIIIAIVLINNGDDEPVADDTTSQATSTDTEESTPTDPTTTETSEDPAIEVDADDYVGRPYRDVQDELSDLGLRVKLEEDSNDGSETPDLVSRLSPSGSFSDGDSITVYYWGPEPETTEPTEETEPTEPTLPTLPTDDLTDNLPGGEG